MTAALVYRPGLDIALDELEDALTDAFDTIRAAVSDHRPVVIVVDEELLRGVGEPASVAFVHGLLGLTRAFGVEGRKPGWQVSLLACGPDVGNDERTRWIARLSDPQGATGELVRLGAEHLGRLPT